jgi:protein-S-isoprenylcysteine O-methyltransferase Ste14
MKSKSEKFRLPVSRAATLISLVFLCTTRSRWETNHEAVTTILFFLATILVGVASLGRLWCSLYIAGFKNHRLITEGPYSLSRNPLYFFSSIGAIGLGLATETLTFPLAFILMFFLYYPRVIKGEEKRLKQLHGLEFDVYRNQVPAFFPKLKGFIEPETYSVKPVVFRRHVLDAVWFIWILGIIELVEGLKEIGVLPALWALY